MSVEPWAIDGNDSREIAARECWSASRPEAINPLLLEALATIDALRAQHRRCAAVDALLESYRRFCLLEIFPEEVQRAELEALRTEHAEKIHDLKNEVHAARMQLRAREEELAALREHVGRSEERGR